MTTLSHSYNTLPPYSKAAVDRIITMSRDEFERWHKLYQQIQPKRVAYTLYAIAYPSNVGDTYSYYNGLCSNTEWLKNIQVYELLTDEIRAELMPNFYAAITTPPINPYPITCKVCKNPARRCGKLILCSNDYCKNTKQIRRYYRSMANE
jgi:hypothetical protein